MYALQLTTRRNRQASTSHKSVFELNRRWAITSPEGTKSPCAITGRNGIGGWGKAGRVRLSNSSDALPASDAPAPTFTGHRPGNAFFENQACLAALPQPPLPLDLLDVW